MNKAEYLAQLSYLLQDLPDPEKEDILHYYEDYFDEGGAEKEEEIIRTLGSPERLAAMIKDGMMDGASMETGEYTDSGYRDERFREDDKVPDSYRSSFYSETKEGHGDILVDRQREKRNKILLVLIAFFCMFGLGFRLPGFIFVAVVFLVLKYMHDNRSKQNEEKKEKSL